MSSDLIKDRQVDLPYTEVEIRYMITKHVKTSLSTQWAFDFRTVEFNTQDDYMVMYEMLKNLHDGQWLLPKFKDYRHVNKGILEKLDGFHAIMDKRQFI